MDGGIGQETRPVRARLADVASAAGTSKPIASRILNGDPTLSVGQDLRTRVLRVARELGYRPHAAARSLRRAQTGALGMLVPPLVNPVYIQLVRGAFKRAAERGFTVLLAEDFEEQEAGEIFARLVLEGRIDGLLVGSLRPGHPLLPLLEQRPVPHVFVNRALEASGRNVVMDDAGSVGLALVHLRDLGHRHVVHVSGPDLEPVTRRANAFVAWSEQLGLEHDLVDGVVLLEEGGVEGARRALERRPELTAIFTSTVSQGIGAINALWKAGLKVPDDVSVIAHADMPLAGYIVPPLTAIQMPLAELGAAGVDALLEQIETGETREIVVDAAPTLALRSSTCPPRRQRHSR
jgi:DNA-binding LacI/PurR family transcriptional regulator